MQTQNITNFSEKYTGGLASIQLDRDEFSRVVHKCQLKAVEGEMGQRSVKIINRKINDSIRLQYEEEILTKLDHPNMIKLYEVCKDEDRLYLMMESWPGVSLFEEIRRRKRFNEEEALLIIKQILLFVAYCHHRNVALRDIKLENIMVDTENNNAVKFVDFSTAQVFETSNHVMNEI